MVDECDSFFSRELRVLAQTIHLYVLDAARSFRSNPYDKLLIWKCFVIIIGMEWMLMKHSSSDALSERRLLLERMPTHQNNAESLLRDPY